MSKFLIQVSHTPQECSEAMDEVSRKGSDVIEKTYWGCHFGEHTSWTIIDASSESEALRSVPNMLQDRAEIIEVEQLTPEQVRQAHQ